MYLQTLIVNGFKSFLDAKIEFPQGITAVVGPNGTGKSNIVDAILWGMGEQSVKTLRSERMEDVIFNGTELRKPLGMVDVSLILGGVTNQEFEALSALGDDLKRTNEVMITRRLYRDGESEYSLNKIPCRLKDIRSLLWAARAGTKGHSVIEQGNIDQLLNASPHERREFIEETAGIIRYKKQKAEAIRKLDSTEHNLLRVRDILAEVRRQLRSLDRQAKQAQAYKTLQHEARTLEIQLLQWEHRTLVGMRRDIEKELEESEKQELAYLAKETQSMAEHEEAKLSLASTSETVTHLRGQLREVEQGMAQALTGIEVERNRLDQYEKQHEQAMNERARMKEESEHTTDAVVTIQERLSQIRYEIESLTNTLAEFEQQTADLTPRRQSVLEELEKTRASVVDITVENKNAENRMKSLDEARQVLARRLERLANELVESEAHQAQLSSEGKVFQTQRQNLEQELEQLRRHREEIEQSHESLQDQFREIEADLSRSRQEKAGTESRLQALQAVIHEEFGYGPTGEIEETSLRGMCREIKEAFVERMDVVEQVDKAIEVALGDRIKAWIVDSPSDAARAITLMKERSLGRGAFVALQWVGGMEEKDLPWWPALHQENQVLGLAANFVTVPDELNSAIASFLSSVVIVENLDAALGIMDRHNWFQGQGPLLVTLEGETVHPSGLITGGSVGESGGVLRRRREILGLEERTKELVTCIEEDERRRTDLVSEIESTKLRIQDLDNSLRENEVQLFATHREEGTCEQSLSELARRVETIRMEHVSEEAEDTQLEEETTQVQQRVAELETRQSEQEQRLRLISDDLRRIEEEANEVNAQITETRLSLSTLQARWTHDQGDLARLEQEESARKVRSQSLDEQLEQLFLQTRESQEARQRNESCFEGLESRKESIEKELLTLEEQYTQVLGETKELDRRLANIRESLAGILKARSAVEVRLAEVRTKLETVETTLTSTYELSLDSLEEFQSKPTEEHNDASGISLPESWQEQLKTVRSKLERMGPINLAAIEEQRELEERCQFLTTQEEDLAKSIQSLQEIIQRLNQTTGRLFSETFRELQEKFSEVFSALFAGGRAELVLVEPEEEEGGGQLKQEPGVDIIAQPPGKRLKNLSMLSGGEKTLTVMALLFSSFLIRPSPFCILDEVDAPLDEANITRFSQFMSQMAEQSQFIIITHNKRTMEVADSLFGITMEEPGVSKLVSVRLNELQEVG